MGQVDVEQLIIQAHSLYSDISIYEIYDLDRDTAIQRINELYNEVDLRRFDEYFSIVEQVRAWAEGGLTHPAFDD